MQLLQILKVFMALLPLVSQAVTAVEQALPVGGVGQQKLEMVKDMLQQAFGLANDVSVTFEQVWPMIDKLITSIVAASNAAKLFNRQQ